jgi:CRISPR-associated endonuclease/helicase Cas3
MSLSEKVMVVGVIVNTVDAARQIFDRLRDIRGPDTVALLIGRIRPYDRDRALEQWLPRIAVGRDRSVAQPTFVVATQTIEVGADIDLDALVTEAAPLDVLRQRFGRLDRLGDLGESNAVVLQGPGRLSAYGDATQNAWRWLNRRGRKTGGEKVIDFGAVSIDELVEGEAIEDLCTPVTHAPIMLPAHVEAWCQTNPSPQADPAVAPFLHGPEAFDADEVEVVWRADLEDRWIDAVSLAPPDVREAMPVPIHAAREWLSNRDVFIWRGIDDPRTGVRGAKSIRPGDTVVIPTDYGGSDEFGWKPKSLVPVTDLGDMSGRWVRLHPALLDPDTAHRLKKLVDSEELDVIIISALLSEIGITDAKPENARRYGSGIILRRRPDNQAEDDASSVMSVPVLLSDHLRGVERQARRFAQGCGLSSEMEEALALAARLQDLGKLDPRFQALLHEGDLLAAHRALANGRALAKSGAAWSLVDYQRYRAAAAYPRLARHEAGSVKFAEQLTADKLILHLIASHHGYARPWIPLWKESPGIVMTVRLENSEYKGTTGCDLGFVNSSSVDRFWYAFEKYGPWRVAYLEAILRLADHRHSQEESGG